MEKEYDNYSRKIQDRRDFFNSNPENSRYSSIEEIEKLQEYEDKKLNALSRYNDPTAHFRMIREEISKTAQDGLQVLQFPTGETAMKIEGLGNRNEWRVTPE